LITITRRTARLVRAVVRRALGLSGGSGPSILFQARNDHLRVGAASDDVVAEYRCAGDFDDEQVWVPYECLVACEARNDDPVQFDVRSGHLTVQWRDSSGPQMVQHEVTENGEREPLRETPHELQRNPPALRQALHHAVMTTEREAIRYAVDHIQLRGETGEIVATDGRQLLIQSGFEFPWQEDVLVPRNLVFGCGDLPGNAPVFVASTGEWVVFRIGEWTFNLKIATDKRYPEVDPLIPRPQDAVARFHLASGDARFLSKSVPRLPVDDELNEPVTVDLNGCLAIRAKANGQPHPTEIVLANSQVDGDPMRFNCNRRYLVQAVKLGFRHAHLYGPNVPAMFHDECRSYVWALLDPETAIPPDTNAVRVESSAQLDSQESSPQPTTRRRKRLKMTEPKPNQQSGSDPNTEETAADNSAENGNGDVIEQAEAVKASLREAASKTSQLITALKRHRKQAKAVQSTLTALKQLQNIEA